MVDATEDVGARLQGLLASKQQLRLKEATQMARSSKAAQTFLKRHGGR